MMRKYVYIILASAFYSCSPIGDRNLKNLQNIKKGMHYQGVINIMGKSDTIMVENNAFNMYYEPPFGYSGSIVISINPSDSTVMGIVDGSE